MPSTDMTVTAVDVLRCDAGWRNYGFVKVSTADGIVGWSEYDDVYGAPAVGELVRRLAPRVIGKSAFDHEHIFAFLTGATRPARGGAVAEALGAIENALLDAKAKALGVPCYTILGGKIRDRVPIYWSHFGTWSVSFGDWFEPQVKSLDDMKAFAADAAKQGFAAVKTNILLFDENGGRVNQPGFNAPFFPELNIDRMLINRLLDLLDAIRDGAGSDMEILLDLNFNAKTEGYLKLLRALADFELFWVELDTFEPQSQGLIRAQSPHPIASCETLCGLQAFLPYFDNLAMDVAVIDAIWNGVWQSKKIAAAAEAHEVNIAPHNFYSHLATMINVHFAASTPNLRIMEHDPQRLAWDSEIFDMEPELVDSAIVVPDRPGWGCDPVEEALAEHPPKDITSMFD